jgi:preprotein translocase subunit YajC
MEMLIILALAFGAMYLVTNRTRKQQRAAADFRANLEVGQEVMTGSGLYGTIVAVDGDTITLESMPGNQSRWIRAAIAKLVPADDTADDTLEDDVDEDAEEYEDGEYDAEYEDDAEHDGVEYEAAEYEGVPHDDAEGTRATQGRGATRLDRVDIPDDLSTLDERRPDDGTDRR